MGEAPVECRLAMIGAIFLPAGVIRITYCGDAAGTHGLGMDGADNYEKIKEHCPLVKSESCHRVAPHHRSE